MKKENKDYWYLINIYSYVDEYLSDKAAQEDRITEVIVNFCTVIEKIIKIQLYNKNPILIYENSQIKDNNALIAIIKKNIEIDMKTIIFEEALTRYQLLFNRFSEDEIIVIRDIYKHRKNLVHWINPDNNIILERENILKKMGTVWSKVSKEMASVFGNSLIKSRKPKKVYSETELEKILEEEVKKKIDKWNNNTITWTIRFYTNSHIRKLWYSLGEEKCPRCGNYSFSLDNWNDYDIINRTASKLWNYWVSNLYKCSECNLELTQKEYEISKRIS